MCDTLELLSERLPSFKRHAFIKVKQAKTFNETCTTTRPGHSSIQCDFSENATVMHQDEIQSMYWSHGQVSIFTAVAWTDEGVYSFGVTSDSLSHGKYAATTYLKAVIDDLQSKLTTKLTEVDIFSDGAAQHFKQKYMFLWATSLERRGIKVN